MGALSSQAHLRPRFSRAPAEGAKPEQRSDVPIGRIIPNSSLNPGLQAKEVLAFGSD